MIDERYLEIIKQSVDETHDGVVQVNIKVYNEAVQDIVITKSFRYNLKPHGEKNNGFAKRQDQ